MGRIKAFGYFCTVNTGQFEPQSVKLYLIIYIYINPLLNLLIIVDIIIRFLLNFNVHI